MSASKGNARSLNRLLPCTWSRWNPGGSRLAVPAGPLGTGRSRNSEFVLGGEASHLRILIALLLAIAIVPLAHAQSIVSGTIVGIVRDESALPLGVVHVVITEVGTGFQREMHTSGSGAFEFVLVPDGVYEVFAERLGYRPVRVHGVVVDPGRQVHVPLSLRTAVPPVVEVDDSEFVAPLVERAEPNASWRFGRLELEGLPHRRRDIVELGRFSSISTEDLATEGLPARLGGVVIDGFRYTGASHPGLAGSAVRGALFPISAFDDVRLMTNGGDVEYAGFAAPHLNAHTRGGGRKLDVSAFADWSGEKLTQSDHFDPDRLAHDAIRGGISISGPLIRDTVHFSIGAEAQRLEVPMPRAWEPTALDSALLAVASDSFGVDLAGYLRPQLVTTDLVSAFGRLDWQIGGHQRLSMRANVAGIDTRNPDLGPQRIPGVGGRVEGTDAAGVANLTSTFSGGGFELRFGFESSKREYTVADPPATLFTSDPVALGVDPLIPGKVDRSAFRGSGIVHLRLGKHQLKLGGFVAVTSFERTFGFARSGQFVFADADDFSTTQGFFMQSVGRPPIASFATSEFGGFVQSTWRARPDVQMRFGLRIDAEILPDGEVALNDAWRQRTGLANDSIDHSYTKVSPRFGLQWNLGNRHRWLLQVEAGIHHGQVGPESFAEIVTESGGAQVRRGVGSLLSWPMAPDSSAAPVVGPRLTLLGPDFEAPRTARTAFTLSSFHGRATAVHLSAAYRHTDFLPRRHDLNLLPAPAARDQYGRPIYGTLVKRGGLLTVEPESNRRFSGFDVVSAIDPDGVSDYWGITLRVERRAARWFNFDASYTYSRTTDNWLSGRGDGPGHLNPFPDNLGDEDWADGRSDFDLPHRAVVSAELALGPLRLAGFFRYQSGNPFTPGFRDGIDANGDGSFRNDPAFVDDEIPGMSELLANWDCLRRQVGQFVDRNACRGSSVESVDLRLTVRPVRVGDYAFEILVDALNVLDSDMAELDRALYLVDAGNPLSVDPTTGDVSVPLVVNPNFGRPAARRGLGRSLRVGVRINHE